jgi:hypothetical protein
MTIYINKRIEVKYYDIWVTLYANCYLLDNTVEVEDIEWDYQQYTEIENNAIQAFTEYRSTHGYFVQAFEDELLNS